MILAMHAIVKAQNRPIKDRSRVEEVVGLINGGDNASAESFDETVLMGAAGTLDPLP